MEYKLFIDGKWAGESPSLEVTYKYSSETIASFSQASEEDVDVTITAIAGAASAGKGLSLPLKR